MIEFLNVDCMAYMAKLPDKAFDLAIVDPPYGIEDKISKGGGSHTKSKCNFHNLYSDQNKKWDVLPDDVYFNELFRVTKHQIIWGGNYFSCLPATRGFICWDKVRYIPNFSDSEFAWTSFDRPAKIFKYCNNGGFVLGPFDQKIHPTQKPIKLYQWLLHNYAKPGQRILDTHLGSGSSAIAAHYYGVDFVGCELDTDYFNAAQERFRLATAQRSLLDVCDEA